MSKRKNRSVKLYHYTKRQNLFGIAMGGLEPHLMPNEGACRAMTMGQPVVWLTTQETLKPTKADLDHIRSRVGDEEASVFAESMFIGRDVRLTVNLSELSKKLAHYHTWLSTTDIVAVNPDDHNDLFTGRDFLKHFTQCSAEEHWWIYFGTIKPSRIELDTTVENMLPGIESNLAKAIKDNDADWIASATDLRDRIKNLAPDTLLSFTGSSR